MTTTNKNLPVGASGNTGCAHTQSPQNDLSPTGFSFHGSSPLTLPSRGRLGGFFRCLPQPATPFNFAKQRPVANGRALRGPLSRSEGASAWQTRAGQNRRARSRRACDCHPASVIADHDDDGSHQPLSCHHRQPRPGAWAITVSSCTLRTRTSSDDLRSRSGSNPKPPVSERYQETPNTSPLPPEA